MSGSLAKVLLWFPARRQALLHRLRRVDEGARRVSAGAVRGYLTAGHDQLDVSQPRNVIVFPVPAPGLVP
jgi:hypothetical protein